MGKQIILTGDRPTGPLHLGHYVGSLMNRVKLQHEYNQYVIIADMQALTDNFETPEKIRMNIVEIALDYLSVGIDPKVTTIFIQSMVPQIAELTMYFMNLVSVQRIGHNPTLKAELKDKGFHESSIPAGFFMYPVSQAADIAVFRANLVPVGEDQLPMIEMTRYLVKTFNSIYGNILVEPEALTPKIARLPGTDGQMKMGKSLGNTINLSDPADVVQKKVMTMFTDPKHLKASDPGDTEGNPVFAYLRAFDPDQAALLEMEDHYRKGGLGDVVVKKHLAEVLNDFLGPIRIKRKEFAKDKDQVLNMVKEGTEKARQAAAETMKEVRKAMKIDYFD